MHKGRFCPRVVPQYLSQDCAVPLFAPMNLRINAQFSYDGLVTEPASIEWAEAVVDVEAQTVTFTSEFSADGNTFHWSFAQSRDGDPTPLKLTVKITDDDGGELLIWLVPPVGEFGYTDQMFNPGRSGSTSTGRFAPGLGNFSYQAKPWR